MAEKTLTGSWCFETTAIIRKEKIALVITSEICIYSANHSKLVSDFSKDTHTANHIMIKDIEKTKMNTTPQLTAHILKNEKQSGYLTSYRTTTRLEFTK